MAISGISFSISTSYTWSGQMEKACQGRACEGSDSTGRSGKDHTSPAKELTEEEKHEVDELKMTDQKVRTHEQAHVAAGGAYVTGGPTYQYQTGPDGRRYAVGGEVGIDTSPVKDDPEATIRKMQTVKKAALAPADPSAQDRSVAARAAQEEAKARQDLREESAEAGETPGRSAENPGVSRMQPANGETGKFSSINTSSTRSLSGHAIDLIA
jgi:hypothetical protein